MTPPGPAALCCAFAILTGGCAQRGDGPKPQTSARATGSEPTQTKDPAQTAGATTPQAALDCDAGTADCDEEASSGCEAQLASDDAHCGACDQPCQPPSHCVEGGCRAGIVELAAGGSHTCAAAADGTLFCWGLNGVGQLGLPGPRVRRVATPTELTDVVRVVAGRYHTCALTRDAHVRCFGEPGQHGGGNGNGVRPKLGDVGVVEGLRGVTDLSTASNHSCAVHAGGKVSCWGANTMGQLGDGTTERRQTPVRVPLPSPAVAVAAGNGHSCALDADGGVRCWGMNRYGQLGDGTTDDRLQPVAVAGLADVVQIDAGEFHGCARTRDGKLHCWGRNEAGQLGLGDREPRPTPATVALDDVRSVSVGQRHTCALRGDDGELLCWGDNGDGRLGDGSRRDRSSPVAVARVQGATDVSAGGMHTCASTDAGVVLCWGMNDGQLGDGTLEPRRRAVEVTGKRFVAAAAEGRRPEPPPPRVDGGVPADAGATAAPQP